MSAAVASTRKLGAERALREALGTANRDRTEELLAGISQAARSSADLAWILTRPVRSHEELTRDIGRLMMRRLRKELRVHVGQLTAHPGLRPAWTQLVCVFALSAFTGRMLELEEAERAISNVAASGPH